MKTWREQKRESGGEVGEIKGDILY